MKLYPKLNIDYKIKDFLHSILSFFSKNKIEIEDNDTLFLNHARTAIRIALSSFGLRKTSRVGMTAYNCDTVMQSIKKAGFEIEFIDITDNFTLDLDDLAKKSKSIDALIVTHLYGIVNDMHRIKNICPNIPIIEDCAHAFLSANDTVDAGTIGDIATYSIGLGKFPSISEGGLLKINNSLYLDKLQSEYEKLPFYKLKGEFKLLIKNSLYAIAYSPTVYKFITNNLKKKRGVSNSISDFEERKMSKQSLYLFRKKEKNFEALKKKQQENTTYIISKLNDNRDFKIPNYNFSKTNGFMLPVLLSNKNSLLLTSQNLSIEVTTHFANSIKWAKSFGYKNNYCKNAEKIANSIMIIPTHYNLNKQSIENLLNSLQNEN